jgi:hypothetical protein
MAYKRSSDSASQKSASAPKAPPQPLGSLELSLFRSVIGVIAPDWTVELHGFCAGEASLIVVPDSGEDLTGPSFAVSRESFGFKLDQVHWDVVTEIGVYSTLPEVLATIRRELAFCSGAACSGSVTIH